MVAASACACRRARAAGTPRCRSRGTRRGVSIRRTRRTGGTRSSAIRCGIRCAPIRDSRRSPRKLAHMPPPSEHCSKRCGAREKCRTGRHNNKWPDEATADARTTRESAHYRLADLGDVGRQSVTRDAVDIALAKLLLRSAACTDSHRRRTSSRADLLGHKSGRNHDALLSSKVWSRESMRRSTGPATIHTHAPVAQLDRVLRFERSGREFESLRARHHFKGLFRLP